MIRIKGEGGAITHVEVDGVDLSKWAYAISLKQQAGELPELTVSLHCIDGVEIELPEGVIIVEKDADPEDGA